MPLSQPSFDELTYNPLVQPTYTSEKTSEGIEKEFVWGKYVVTAKQCIYRKAALEKVNGFDESLRYLANMCGEIASDHNAKVVERMTSLIYLIAKLLGFSLGQIAPWLPATLHSKLSYTRAPIATSTLKKASK